MKENKQKRLNKKAINKSMRWFNPNDSSKYNYNYIKQRSKNYTINTIG
jgi:hypothetical protein